jgi:hypothetical protein
MAYYGQNVGSTVTKHLAWEDDTAVKADELRRTTLLGAAVVLRSNSDRTTRSAFDTLEAGNWTYVGQAGAGIHLPSEVKVTGVVISESTYLWRSGTATDTTTDFTADIADWLQLGRDERISEQLDFLSNSNLDVDTVTHLVLGQTTADINLTFDTPATTGVRREVKVSYSASATAPISIAASETVLVPLDQTYTFAWDKVSWKQIKPENPLITRFVSSSPSIAVGQPVVLTSTGNVKVLSTPASAITASWRQVSATTIATPSVARKGADGFIYLDASAAGAAEARSRNHVLNKATGLLGAFGAFQPAMTGTMVGSAASIAVSEDGTCGMIAAQITGNLSLQAFVINGDSVEFVGGVTSIPNATVNTTSIPKIVPTSRRGRYLLFGSNGANVQIQLIDAQPSASASPVVTAGGFGNLVLAGAKRASILRVTKSTEFTSDLYVVVYVATGPIIQARTFTGDPIANTLTAFGALTTVNSSGAVQPVEAEVVAETRLEVFIAYTNFTGNSIGAFKVNKFTGDITALPLLTVGADTPVVGTRFITPLSLATGRFLMSHVIGTATVRSAEISINTTTGAMSIVSAVSTIATLPNTVQPSTGWGAHDGAGHSVKAFQLATNTGLLVIGRNATLESSNPGYIGIALESGVLGAEIKVALKGSIATGLTGLIPGYAYYLDEATGGLTTDNIGQLVGRALSATELLVL